MLFEETSLLTFAKDTSSMMQLSQNRTFQTICEELKFGNLRKELAQELYPCGLKDGPLTRPITPLFQLLRGVHPSTAEIICERYESIRAFLENKTENLE